MTSFGKSIIPHLVGAKKQPIQTNKNVNNDENSILKSQKEDNESGTVKRRIEQESRKKREDRSINTELSHQQNAIVQTVPIDYQETRVELSDYANSNKTDKATQSPHRERKLRPKTKDERLDEEKFFEEFRPPPLFFNSELDAKSPHHAADSKQLVTEIKSKQSYLSVRMEYLSMAVRNQELLEGTYQN